MKPEEKLHEEWPHFVLPWTRLILALALGGGAVYELISGHPSFAGIGAALAFVSSNLNRLEQR